jgi:hypothetical protein
MKNQNSLQGDGREILFITPTPSNGKNKPDATFYEG